MHETRRTKTAACLLVSTLALAGCISAPLGTFYKPSYDSANVRYTGNMCRGGAGAPAVMEVALADGVTLSASAVDSQGPAASNGAPVTFDLTLKMSNGGQVQFASERIDVVADGHDQTIPAPSLQVSARGRIAPGALFDPKREGPTPELFSLDPQRVSDFRSSAVFGYSIPDFRPARIQAQLPGLRVMDGSLAHELPPLVLDADAVQLERAAGVAPTTYATAQANDAVTKQYEACTRNPQRTAAQCRQILDFHDRRFNVDRGNVHYTGRWWVLGPGSPFRGELTIEQGTPAAWQLTPAEVRVRDAAGTRMASVPLGRIVVNLRYTAPFGAAFTAVNNDPIVSPTRVSFSIPLPPAAGRGPAQRYVIRMPELSINGKLLPLRPIQFERHRFEVGVLPFNC